MNTHQWYLMGLVTKKSFVSTWDTTKTASGSSASTQVKLPLQNIEGVYNFTVNWGDGNSNVITVWNQAETTHTYSSSGIYTITINGICKGFRFVGTGDRLKILSVQSWGGLNLGNSGSYFTGCTNLNLISVSDVLDLTGTLSLIAIFDSCSSLIAVNKMNEWNTSAVTNMSYMFNLATSFNQNIGSWNTANVTNMEAMFRAASVFNQNIGSWNVSKVTTMAAMFQFQGSFNQNIGSWNVSKVTDFTSFMPSKTTANFSTANLDAIYNGWSSRPVLSGKTITFGSAKYTSASSTGRAILTGAPNNWTITDGGI